MKNFKPLNLSKSNLSRILKNILYAGKVKIPAYKNEKETIIDGLHEPIISIHLFNKVQNILQSKRRIKTSSYDDVLFMRGYLKCDKCGGNLTGSGSKSKTGKKHFYYHCNPRNGCNERFRVDLAHKSFKEFISSFKPREEVSELFKVLLQKHFEKTKDSKSHK